MATEIRKVIPMPQPEVRVADAALVSRPAPALPGWVSLNVPAAGTPQPQELAEGVQRALNALHENNLSQAAAELESVLAQGPSFAASFYLGCLEHKRGNKDLARLHYMAALEIDALSWQPLFNLALLEIEDRQPESARRLLERAALLNLEVVEVRWRLGILAESLDEFAEAEYWYERVIALDPDHGGARFRLGMLRLKRGDLDSAILHLEACQSGHPDCAHAAYHLGLCQLQKGLIKESRLAFERARNYSPKCAEFTLALGIQAMAEHDLERAERHERELRELNSASAALSYNLSRAWLERGQPERAKRLYRHAVETDPSLAHGYFRS